MNASLTAATPTAPRSTGSARPRRLLHVFPSFALGGAQRRTIDLANAFGGRYAHTILALDGDTSASRLIDKTVALAFRNVTVRRSAGVALDNLQRLRGLLREERPDLLLTYNFGALEAALANRWRPLCRHVHFEDGFGPEETTGKQLARRVWLRRLALSGNSVMVVPSRTLEQIALTRWSFARERVHYIPNGIDMARYALDNAVQSAPPSWPSADLVVGSVGGLRPEKNHARLLRAFAALPANGRPLRLVLVGEGSERGALERHAIQLGIADRITLAGYLADPRPTLRAFDVFALSSDTEQMPYSLVEAMASGLPVVATDVGDVRTMLPSSADRWVVPVADEAAFSERLGKLLHDQVSRQEIGRRNLAHASTHFDIDTMIRQYDHLFRGLIDGVSPGERGNLARARAA